MTDRPSRVVVKPRGWRIPRTRHEWASLVLGVAAILHGLGRMILGDSDLSVLVEISAGLGVFGLPSLLKEHSHIEIVSDRPLDMTALNDAAEQVARDMRIGGSGDDTESLRSGIYE